MSDEPSGPSGELAIRVLAMPADTNSAGDIFGGWIMGQMDIAAGVTAHARAEGRTVTVAVSNLTFVHPVKVGDVVAIYANTVATGRTSITVDVEVWIVRQGLVAQQRVTHARFVMVAVDAEGRPRPVPPLQNAAG